MPGLLLAVVMFALGPALAQDPIQIGMPLALTGPLAASGEENRRGILLFVEE